MNINLRLFSIFSICLMSTACSTTSLNRTLVHEEKIKIVYVNELNGNISIEKSNSGKIIGTGVGGVVGALVGNAIDSNTNSKRAEGLTILQGKINDFNVNKIIQNALTHHVQDSAAFSDEVEVTSEFDSTVKKPYLIPVLTPSIIMSADYSSIDITLKTSTSQKAINSDTKQNQYKGKYESNQIISSASTSKDENKQYWIDNPVDLKERVVNGLYDVTKQFADDFNSLEKIK